MKLNLSKEHSKFSKLIETCKINAQMLAEKDLIRDLIITGLIT